MTPPVYGASEARVQLGGSTGGAHRHAHAVAGEAALPSLALANGPLGALPPALSAGGAEALHDDIVVFFERLRAAGVDCVSMSGWATPLKARGSIVPLSQTSCPAACLVLLGDTESTCED
jgi:hypothetical protein